MIIERTPYGYSYKNHNKFYPAITKYKALKIHSVILMETYIIQRYRIHRNISKKCLMYLYNNYVS